jgi:rod shape-determining protein MreC
MELFRRHRNLFVLAVALFAQVLGLAVQVRRPTEAGSARLVHVWGISLFTPAERGAEHSREWLRHLWRDYFYLRDVRSENEELRRQILHLRLEQVRLVQDASQAQRLQALLQFKEQFISGTVAAQVIGSSGSEQSRVLYLDKGANDGLRADMAVITPAGIVGKIVRVLPATAQVLEINDPSSGVGAILEKSRLQGIVKGSVTGEVSLNYVMADQNVEPGELALTSGGDRIFPKGLTIGQVVQATSGNDTFLHIRIRPAARLDRIEEVLVITKVVEMDRPALPEAPMRAAEILAQRLPTVQPKPPAAETSGTNKPNPAAPGTVAPKPPATRPGAAAGETARP